MNQQRHIVKRQIIEITTDFQPLAERAQDKISKLLPSQLKNLIDKHCSNYSDPDTVYRIDSMEIDLGLIHIDNFEKELIHRLDKQFKKQLAKYINGTPYSHNQTQTLNKNSLDKDAGVSRKTTHKNRLNSRFELLSYFARNGYLPWWADTKNENLLVECLDDLLQTPAVLRQLFHTITRQKKPLLRIIQHFDDVKLQQLLVVLTPAGRQITAYPAAQLIASLTGISCVAGITQHRVKQVVWYALLQTVMSSSQHIENQQSYLYEVLHSISLQLAVPFMVLVNELRSKIPFINSEADRVDFIKLLFDFSRKPEDLKLLFELSNKSEDLNTLDKIQKLLNQQYLPGYFVKELLTSLQQVKFKKTDSTLFLQKVTELIHALNKRVELGLLDKKQQDKVLLEKEDTKQNRFTATDEIYIENAGLAVLCPFLERFFNTMSWIQDKQFKSDQAQQRALIALHYLASAGATAQEYMLPLNKVLCGMPIDALYNLETSLQQDEIDTCEEFLQAVIDNAPILKNTTVDGFRASFLMRQGILSQRDGAWLLRVERQTHDIILDRFPWGFEWVRLPWMPLPMRVEW